MAVPTYGEMRSRTERIADEALKQRVVAGLEVLREKHGDDWVEKIDCETLDLRSFSSCVLGQVYRDYSDGCADLMPASSDEFMDEWATDHGFYEAGGIGAWEALDEVWHAILCDKDAIPGKGKS